MPQLPGVGGEPQARALVVYISTSTDEVSRHGDVPRGNDCVIAVCPITARGAQEERPPIMRLVVNAVRRREGALEVALEIVFHHINISLIRRCGPEFRENDHPVYVL